MREDNLDRALKRIKEKTPKFFYQYCVECKHRIKKEPMWRIKYGELAIWMCKRCAPTLLDLVRNRPKTFSDVDFSPLYDDDARVKRNKALGIEDAGV